MVDRPTERVVNLTDRFAQFCSRFQIRDPVTRSARHQLITQRAGSREQNLDILVWVLHQ
jgi:hypothetical protein